MNLLLTTPLRAVPRFMSANDFPMVWGPHPPVTLAQLAAKNAGYDALLDYLTGPTGMAFGITDPIIVDNPVTYGPAVPDDFVPLTSQQLADQGYDSNSVAIGSAPPGYVLMPDGSLQPIAGTSKYSKPSLLRISIPPSLVLTAKTGS